MSSAQPNRTATSPPPFPLPYCLNVHPGADAIAVRRALADHLLPVKRILAPDRPFPVSLHVGRQALRTFSRPRALAGLRQWLSDHNCFVAGINAFPYGSFHSPAVKARVYRPDWRSPRRLDYTLQTARLLAELIPEHATATLTTVPGGWLPDWTTPADERMALHHIAQAARGVRRLHKETGRRIRIAIEPEPGCAWTFSHPRLNRWDDEICWCLDTSHAAVEFRSIESCDWGRIGRVQLSAAIECDNSPSARRRLAEWAEPRYLHQTRAAVDGEIIGSWPDLPPALAALPGLPVHALIRTHFHVPLTWKNSGPLRSTRPLLTPAFFRRARQVFCEVETYTYAVLPDAHRPAGLHRALAAELRWAASRLA